MLTLVTLASVVSIASYPMMILLRLKIICRIHPIIMYIPIIHAIIWGILRYFLIKWYLTHDNYYYHIFYIVRPTITTTFSIQNIIINVFFIILAKKKFTNLIYVRNVIIINIIVILIECVIVITEFLYPIVWDFILIPYQIMIKLELSVLDYIIETYRRPNIVRSYA